MKSICKLLLAVFVLVLALDTPAEAGLRDRLGGGGGGKTIGLGLKKPNAEVGEVECRGPFCKMKEAQPQPEVIEVAAPPKPEPPPGVNPIIYAIACCPLMLVGWVVVGTGAYFLVRSVQERSDE